MRTALSLQVEGRCGGQRRRADGLRPAPSGEKGTRARPDPASQAAALRSVIYSSLHATLYASGLMAGHSKWAQIKRQKAVTDAKRGRLFTKLGRELTIAAQQGGPDPSANVRLEQAVGRAKAANMPRPTIDRAIQRGAGGGADGGRLEELVYEGYASDGAGLLIEVVTDNRNRSVAEVRNALNRLGGTLAAAGAVAWQFETRGAIDVPIGGHDADDIELTAIDLGALDVERSDGFVHVSTGARDLARVKTDLQSQGFAVESAELTMTPTATMQLDDRRAARVLEIVESIEELDDVRRVHTNVEISDALLARVGS